MGLVILTKETPQRSRAPSTRRGHGHNPQPATWRTAFTRIRPCCFQDTGLSASGTMGNKSPLSIRHPVLVLYYPQPPERTGIPPLHTPKWSSEVDGPKRGSLWRYQLQRWYLLRTFPAQRGAQVTVEPKWCLPGKAWQTAHF